MNDLERLLASEEIRQLACRYALAMDHRDLDTLVSLFVDDVRVGRDASGREALRDRFDVQLREVGITILFVCNHLLDFDDGSHARGIVYCQAEIQDGDRWIRQAIQYRDRYELRGDTWLFARRVHLLWYGAELGESPLGLEPANWPESHTGRGTLPESETTWQRFWATPGGNPERGSPEEGRPEEGDPK